MAPQREWFEKDYYKTLGVPKSASEKEIMKAYRRLAKQFHPDANPGDATAEDRFKEISSAYDVLGDAAKRKEYDDVRAMADAGIGFGSPGGGQRSGGFTGNPFGNAGGSQTFSFDDIGDLFGGLFNRGQRNRGSGPQRGDDLRSELHLSFLDAINGAETTVNVVSDMACSTCHGTGAEPGTTPATCQQCGGRGVLDDNQGVFSFSRPCPVCGGVGKRVEHPCKACRGSGTERRSRQVKVRIPPGVDDGQQIRLKNRGSAGRNGGPAGDLYVTVHVAPHPVFGRKGPDLTVTVPVTYPELAVGATITVPTLERPVSVKIPQGSKSGRVLRVRGRGIPIKSGHGDLLVTIELYVPPKPSTEEKFALETLTEAMAEHRIRDHLGVER